MLANLVRASVEGAILVSLIWTLTRVWPRVPPRALTVLWWCAAARVLLTVAWPAPIELKILPPARAVVAGISSPATAQPLQPLAEKIAVEPPAPMAAGVNWGSWLLTGWVAGVLLTVGAGVRQWSRTSALVRRAEPAPPEVQALSAGIARALRLRRTPPVRISPEVCTPLVAGIVRPVVVLPSARLSDLSEAGWEMALCHELAHIKRADLWLGCVPALAERVFFFHPLVRLAAREYALCREAACDVTVIQTLGTSPQDYGRLLLALGVTPGRTAAAAGASWSFSTLKRRIIMLEPSTQSRTVRTVAAIAVTLAVAALVPLRLGARPQPALASADRDEVSAARTPADAREQRQRDFSYVLLHADGDTQMSGSDDDVRSAARHRRSGERLLWFRHEGKEFTVREPSVLDQLTVLWQPVGDIGAEQRNIGARQGQIGAQQAAIGVKQGIVGSEQAVIGARQAQVGARQGVAASRGFRVTDAERRSLDAELRKLDDEMRALDKDMRALDVKLRELDAPMTDLDTQMRALDVEMRALDVRMQAAVKKAEEETRSLLARAIGSGAAVPVK